MKNIILHGIVTAAAILAIAALSSPAFGGDNLARKQLKERLFAAYDQKDLVVVHDKMRVTMLGSKHGASEYDYLINYHYIDAPKKEWGRYKKLPTIDDPWRKRSMRRRCSGTCLNRENHCAC
jgi:hypothetical protein